MRFRPEHPLVGSQYFCTALASRLSPARRFRRRRQRKEATGGRQTEKQGVQADSLFFYRFFRALSAFVGQTGEGADLVDDGLDAVGRAGDLAAGHAVAESGLGNDVVPDAEALVVDVDDGGAGVRQRGAVGIHRGLEQTEGELGRGVGRLLDHRLLRFGQRLGRADLDASEQLQLTNELILFLRDAAQPNFFHF